MVVDRHSSLIKGGTPEWVDKKFHARLSFAVLYATTQSHVAIQDSKLGGCLIRAFCDVEKNKGLKHLHEMIFDVRKQTKINAGNKDKGSTTQLLDFQDTLMYEKNKEYQKVSCDSAAMKNEIEKLNQQAATIKNQTLKAQKQLRRLQRIGDEMRELDYWETKVEQKKKRRKGIIIKLISNTRCSTQ